MELELARGPEEEIVDRLLGLDPERAPEILLVEDTVRDQDRAERSALLLLGEQRAEELLLGRETEPDQELAERLAGIVRPGGVDVTVSQDDPLLDRAPHDVQRPRLAPGGRPLEDVRERHRPQVTLEAHGSTGETTDQRSSQDTSQNR